MNPPLQYKCLCFKLSNVEHLLTSGFNWSFHCECKILNSCTGTEQVSPVFLHYVITRVQIELNQLVKLAKEINLSGLLLHFMCSKLRRIRSILNNMQKETRDSILLDFGSMPIKLADWKNTEKLGDSPHLFYLFSGLISLRRLKCFHRSVNSP